MCEKMLHKKTYLYRKWKDKEVVEYAMTCLVKQFAMADVSNESSNELGH